MGLTEKVDIWAAGCILLELFGGVIPYYDCATMAQLSARILVNKKPPDVPPNVPMPIAAVIRNCTNFDATRRCAAGELQQALVRLPPTQQAPPIGGVNAYNASPTAAILQK